MEIIGTAVIGRSSTANVALVDDPFVSKRHARIEWDSSQWLIQDLGSANGTSVRGRRLEGRMPLRDGDVVTAGRTEIMVRFAVVALAKNPSSSQVGNGQKGTRFKAMPLPKPSVNSCPECVGRQVCEECSGQGTVNLPNREPWRCPKCAGSGRCPNCATHVDTIVTIVELIRDGEVLQAEAATQRALMATGSEEASIRSDSSLMGMAGAGVLGLALLGPIGLAIGMGVGRLLADEEAKDSAPAAVAWKRADLFFLLAALYQRQGRPEEARRALVQAATFKEDHAPTLAALKEI